MGTVLRATLLYLVVMILLRITRSGTTSHRP
ncbi:hypothetical protein FHU13_005130 [Methylobacterium sp. R2-1]|nr:hypothetical protein [Methylobacterium sp. R2-1]